MGLIETLRERLVPTDALIFYASQAGKYVEHRKIEKGKMMAGQPLDVKQLADLVKIVESYASGQQKMSAMGGTVPQNLLYVDPNPERMKMVWWRPPEERMMYFKKTLGIPDGTMKVPGVVYKVSGTGSLSVYCFKGKKPKKVLYRAPFFNIYTDGHVCLGNSKTQRPKVNTFVDWMAYWEKMFWQSEFVHLISDNPIDGNLALVTKECIETGKPFPVKVMSRAGVKLNDLMK